MKQLTKNKIGEKITAIVLIMVLTMIDVLYIGNNLIKVIAEENSPISIKAEITDEVYKGYMYQTGNEQKETPYKEKIIVDINNYKKADNIKSSNIQENYVTYQEDLEDTEDSEDEKTLYEIKDSISIKKTEINKEDMIKILGEEGKITIKDQDGNIISEITKEIQEDEEGNIVIEYENQYVSKISIETTKPIKNGRIIFVNEKVIKANEEYQKEQIKQWQALEEIMEVNDKKILLKMNLLDTKPEAKIELSQTNLTTLQKNENVQIKITLNTDKMQYDLYKNPYMEVIFPSNLQIDIKSLNSLNIEPMTVKYAKYNKEDNGETIVQIQLEGEELEYEETVAEGIQFIITADISVDILTPTQISEIKMRYTNENRPNQVNEVKQEIVLQSKEGTLLVSRLSNYNANGKVLENTNDKFQEGELDINSEKRIATMNYYIINNYDKNMDNAVVIGRLPDTGDYQENGKNTKITFGEKLTKQIMINKENTKVYYSEDALANSESTTWTQNVEDLTKMKSFKIEFGENSINPQDVVEISYSMEIPENLSNNQTTMNNLEVTYEQETEKMSINSSNILATPVEIFNQVATTQLEEDKEDISVEMAVLSGGNILENGEEIYEGQAVRYILQITNNKQEPINNFKMVAKHTNVIYYGLKSVYYQGREYPPHVDEQEDLTEKELTVETIEPGQTVMLEYQIVANKNVEEGTQTTGQIILTGEGIEQKEINAYTNPIKQGKLKLKLLCGYSQGQTVYSDNYAYPLELYVENISDEDLNDINFQINLADTLEFNEENFAYEPLEVEATTKKINDNCVQFNIPSLPKGNQEILYIMCGTKKLDISLAKKDISLIYTVNVDGETYTSNQIQQEILQAETTITAEQTGNIEGDSVKTGDNLIYTTVITNHGVIDYEVKVSDELPRGVNPQSVYIIKNGEDIGYSAISNYIAISEIKLQPNETIKLVIDTMIDASIVEGDTITNIVNVNDIESNDVTYKVEKSIEDDPYYDPENPGGTTDPEDPDNPIDPEDPDNPTDPEDPDNPTDPEDPDNPTDPEDPDNPTNPEDPDNPTGPEDPDNPTNPDNPTDSTYSISGVAWVDENANGIKENDEEKIENMQVYLFNQKNGEVVEKAQTGEIGEYSFDNVSTGEYFVVFDYDNSKYRVTEYQNNDATENSNSDVVEKQISQIQNKKVAMTETLKIDDEDIKNIDAGFTEISIFDLKINKYISKVTVQNKNGTTITNFNQAKLAKIEIPSTVVDGSIVTVEYKIEVINEGEIPGYATEIIDDLPEEFKFEQNKNPNWTYTSNGNLITKQLANEIISPGESKTITLVLTKTMTPNNTGNSINIAEINSIDSIAGNSKQSEDDISKAELIISIKTGKIALYISLIILITTLLGVGIYFIKKEVLGKGGIYSENKK